MVTTTTTATTRSEPVETGQKLLLRASHLNLVALNFQIDQGIVSDYIPNGLELDTYHGETFISLIAMVVRKVNFLGFPRKFNLLSLRCYVKRCDTAIARKGTFVLKTYVSSPTAAWILSSKFGRKFYKLKIRNSNKGFQGDAIPQADYHWNIEDHSNRLRVRARAPVKNCGPDTKVGFILSHANHYEAVNGKTLEYRVRRPKWDAWDAAQANFTCDVKHLFGKEFVKPLGRRPASVFVTPGSDVSIFRPTQIG